MTLDRVARHQAQQHTTVTVQRVYDVDARDQSIEMTSLPRVPAAKCSIACPVCSNP